MAFAPKAGSDSKARGRRQNGRWFRLLRVRPVENESSVITEAVERALRKLHVPPRHPRAHWL
jgi:hypothetical protein